jgi:sugar phosphate permease
MKNTEEMVRAILFLFGSIGLAVALWGIIVRTDSIHWDRFAIFVGICAICVLQLLIPALISFARDKREGHAPHERYLFPRMEQLPFPL